MWEIISKTQKYPIGLQVKQGRPYAIRPFAFHKNPEKSFQNIKELIKAVYETRLMFSKNDTTEPDVWYKKVIETINN